MTELNPRLIIIRGLPGSGKSTFAKFLCDLDPRYVHVEADMYFVDTDGAYRWSKFTLPNAHQWCLKTTQAHLQSGRGVVVSNTFTRRMEITPYEQLCEDLNLPAPVEVQLTGEYGNTHGVPSRVIMTMRERWEA